MKNLILTSIVLCAVLFDVAQPLFLGPIAVGLGLGALIAAKGFFLGAVIAGRRSNRHSRYRRSYNSYSPSNHYDTSYNSHYSSPPSYYYSSTKHSYHRGKRSAPEFSPSELSRLRREAESFNFDEWVLDMSTKDQDDCSKKLICELSAKAVFSKKSMTNDEKTLADLFSSSLDINSNKVEFDLAASIGKNKGSKRCKELYKRCETSTEDMLAMISTELEEMKSIQLEIEGLSQAEIEQEIDQEKREMQKKLEEAGVDVNKVWD